MNDWQPLVAQLARRLRLPLASTRIVVQTGGDISHALRLDNGQQAYFVKINRHELLPMFEAERFGLETIAQTFSIRVPSVLFTGVYGVNAYIVMEYIELQTRATSEQLAIPLATALASMHGHYHGQFGFNGNNYIGSNRQFNAFDTDWVRFWRDQRLKVQLDLLAQTAVDAALIDDGYRLSETLQAFYSNYAPRPSLLHGDLWCGNYASDASGCPVIFDPACYYGDHEADLAMMELFGDPGKRFFSAYHEHMPIDRGYPVRRELYNLYHILNHANLFGAAYYAQAKAMIDHLLAQR